MLNLQEWNKSDFHIVEEIFRSNTGAVYKARVRRSGEIVVLKERRAPELGRGRGVMEHEVELLEKVKHPNVIRCYGHFRDNSTTSRTGSFYMVLEYASGGDLYKQILRRRKEKKYFSENSILKIFRQICRGLCALHEMGIIHRDIKTLNILLDKPKSSESVRRWSASKSNDDSEDAFSVQGHFYRAWHFLFLPGRLALDIGAIFPLILNIFAMKWSSRNWVWIYCLAMGVVCHPSLIRPLICDYYSSDYEQSLVFLYTDSYAYHHPNSSSAAFRPS